MTIFAAQDAVTISRRFETTASNGSSTGTPG
jgi:hypothetical protein